MSSYAADYVTGGTTALGQPGGSSGSAAASIPSNATSYLATSSQQVGVSSAPVELGVVTPNSTDIDANIRSDVFGSQLFTGAFARQGPTQFNPDYLVAIGDRIQLRIWGGVNFDSILVVDPQGNLFLPSVGPVSVLGVRNQDLQATVETAVLRVYRANVFCYASLATAQPVRIFVGGFVNRPGLYNGTSMDSLLHYLDQAGGIDPGRGSFLDVQVKRGNQMRLQVSLYDFLLDGRIPQIQLSDGDVIFVAPRHNTIKVSGLAEITKRFEFIDPTFKAPDLFRLTKPSSQVTHIRVIRNTGSVKNIEYLPMEEADKLMFANGDEIEFTSDRKPGSISVRVEGEHLSAQEYVLPYGANFGDLIKNIKMLESSDSASIQLFRLSVRERQKLMLTASLRSLENVALTARSGTTAEASLRKDEAALLLQWVERAKKVEPTGQVLVAQSSQRDQLSLENGDIIRIPKRDGLVLISGEVLFPNAIAYAEELSLDDYIHRAGGYTQNADASRIVIAHRDGSFTEANTGHSWFASSSKPDLRTGDEILVLPKIDVKSRQIASEVTQILYQIAVSARVVLGL